MNLGQINQDNEKFLNDYKKYGYATKTQMANDALRVLRLLKMKESRANWRKEAFTEIKDVAQDYAWQSLDEDDFGDDVSQKR